MSVSRSWRITTHGPLLASALVVLACGANEVTPGSGRGDRADADGASSTTEPTGEPDANVIDVDAGKFRDAASVDAEAGASLPPGALYATCTAGATCRLDASAWDGQCEGLLLSPRGDMLSVERCTCDATGTFTCLFAEPNPQACPPILDRSSCSSPASADRLLCIEIQRQGTLPPAICIVERCGSRTPCKVRY
jgi:hypothetical protein